MKIIAKSFPSREQIQGRIDSGAFDGIELFIMDDIIENPAKYQEIVKFARDNFSVVNFETFYAVNINGRKRTSGIIDPNEEVRARSRALLEDIVMLNDGRGNVNTHFVGIPHTIDVNAVNRNPHNSGEQVLEFGNYLRQFNPHVSAENVITIETIPAGEGEGILLYNAGADVDNFTGLYKQFGIPINFDTAHLGIVLEQYARNVRRKGLSVIAGNPVRIELTDWQEKLGARVLDIGLNNVYIEELKRMWTLIRNVHFSNSALEKESDSYKDGYKEFSAEDGRLVNLDRVLHYLIKERQEADVYQMTAEVVDGLYPEPKPDYARVPHMAEMAKTLKRKLEVF